MPELPEVETVRRAIAPLLVGRTVRGVYTGPPSYFFLTPPAELAARLVGRTITDLGRHGKYLIARLDDGSAVLLHLGMTGQLFTAGAESPRLRTRDRAAAGPDPHVHLELDLGEGAPRVRFRDVRKLGKVKWIPPGAREPRLARLGPDALELDDERFARAVGRRRGAIKSVLLDQSALAGVGNLYADEALFLARIRPTRRASALRPRERAALAAAVREVLARGLSAGGASLDDWVAPDGSDGGYQHARLVYGRERQPCPACQAPLTRTVIGGRSATWCRRCQR
ncbi:MAG: bifunctional DNA-formamidopyrimidine glycosylase/DNA-(apurinic or apyrimidinic site) lyase [Polyangiaceae bacterium]|nr:bifunctional DNA-formamidopyrimidine glycosylase/DNA-(apurinic or apyrimidinic site) lyase [Polyangiaceae bacterium]